MKISIYAPLCDYLKESKEQSVTLAFHEIEKIIDRPLPDYASEKSWWSNHDSHSQAKSGWLAAGYNASVDLNNKTATFVKITDNKPRKNKSASVIYWDAPFELSREPWSIATSVEDEEDEEDENEGIYNDAIKIFEPAYTAADIEGLAKALTKFESIKKFFPDAHGYIDNIKQCIYETAKEKMKSAKTVDEWSKLADVFNKIPNFCQSNDLQRQCSENAKYSKAVNIFNSANEKKDIDKLVEALEIFKYIQNYPEVQKYIEQIKKSIYETAKEKKNVAKTEYDFKAVANIFDKIKGFNEADSLKQQCLGEAERAKKKAIYDKAQNIFESAANKKDLGELVKALEIFKSIKDFLDAARYIEVINQDIYKNAETANFTTVCYKAWQPLHLNWIADNSYSHDFEDGIGKIVLKYSSATEICASAFENCENLKSITIPNSVIEIGERAFKDCPNLISVNIPESVIKIGEEAFEGCRSLTSTNIPESVDIGEYAFYGCRNLHPGIKELLRRKYNYNDF